MFQKGASPSNQRWGFSVHCNVGRARLLTICSTDRRIFVQEKLAVDITLDVVNVYEMVLGNAFAPEDRVDVTVERIAYGGEGVARHQGLVIFVPLAAPGDRLRVRITERRKNYARGVIEQILVASPVRRQPPCVYFGECGGCQLQHLNYAAQLDAKAAFVTDALSRIGGISLSEPIEIRAADEFGYRTRAQIALQRVRSSEGPTVLRIGFNRMNSHSVCDVESCLVLVPDLDRALHAVRSDLKSNADAIAENCIIEMAGGDSGACTQPPISGFDKEYVTRRIGDRIYSLGPDSFFQPNNRLLQSLVDDAVGNRTGEMAIDLYAGVGLFTLQLADSYKRVIGIESDYRAYELALRNRELNQLDNVEFKNARVEHWLSELTRSLAANQSSRPDLVLLDPPRQGAAEAIGNLIAASPKHVTYVSCDPTTLARDLKSLLGGGYELSRVTAFDLFPQTYHVETVAHLVGP